MEQDAQIDAKTFMVTQMINPNHFTMFNPYLRDENARKTLEENLENEIKNFNFSSAKRDLKKNDIVAFYLRDGKRYIRCVIDDIKIFSFIKHYILFALDYGVSLYTTNDQDIHAISEVTGFFPSSIMNNISLCALPAVTRFNYFQDKEVVIFHKSWCESALKIFRHSLNDASNINFKPSNEIPGRNGFLFGDLIITTFYGITFSLTEELIKHKVAKKASSVDEFFELFDELSTKDIERWNDNSRKGGILRFDEGKLPFYYDDEIRLKEYIANCDAVQSRISSVQKVIEWQSRNEVLHHIQESNENDSEEGSWNNLNVGNNQQNDSEKEDEGFDETIVNFKRKSYLLKQGAPSKKSRNDNQDKESLISGISYSVSQIIPHSGKWITKHQKQTDN